MNAKSEIVKSLTSNFTKKELPVLWVSNRESVRALEPYFNLCLIGEPWTDELVGGDHTIVVEPGYSELEIKHLAYKLQKSGRDVFIVVVGKSLTLCVNSADPGLNGTLVLLDAKAVTLGGWNEQLWDVELNRKEAKELAKLVVQGLPKGPELEDELERLRERGRVAHQTWDNYIRRIEEELHGRVNANKEFSSTIQEIEYILESIEDPGEQLFRLERLAAQKRGMTAAKLITIYNDHKTGGKPVEPEDVHDFLGRTPDKREWIIGSRIPKGSACLLVANGGDGKTLLAYDIVKSVASGQNWNGLPTKQGKVLIVQVDEPECDVSERLQISNFHEEVPRGMVHILTNWQFSQTRKLKKWIEEHQPLLVIIDSLTAANRSSEIEEKDTRYGNCLYDLKDFANEQGCTFLVLHHTNKNGGVRGTSAIRNNVSEVWEMRRPDPKENMRNTQRIIDITKSRSGCIGKYVLELDVDDYSWQDQGEYGQQSDGSSSISGRLQNYFKANPGKWFEVDELLNAHSLGGATRETLRRTSQRLARQGLISSETRTKVVNGRTYRYDVYGYFPDYLKDYKNNEKVCVENNSVFCPDVRMLEPQDFEAGHEAGHVEFCPHACPDAQEICPDACPDAPLLTQQDFEAKHEAGHVEFCPHACPDALIETQQEVDRPSGHADKKVVEKLQKNIFSSEPMEPITSPEMSSQVVCDTRTVSLGQQYRVVGEDCQHPGEVVVPYENDGGWIWYHFASDPNQKGCCLPRDLAPLD